MKNSKWIWISDEAKINEYVEFLTSFVYENPILKGFNPDPSICRVDKDFYMVTSSFQFFVGLCIPC